MKFFGRDQELAELASLWGKRTGSLVTCRGRRRIGKSTLIERFAQQSDGYGSLLGNSGLHLGYADGYVHVPYWGNCFCFDLFKC